MVSRDFIDYLSKRKPNAGASQIRLANCTDDPPPPGRRWRTFSAVTIVVVTRVLGIMSKLAELDVPGIVLVGAWRSRQFVIKRGQAAQAPVSGAIADMKALTITLPIDISAEAFARACRSFGGKVEREFRERNLGQFDFVRSRDGGPPHLVHRFHHVALCGCSGPWPDGSMSLDDFEGDVCSRCQHMSTTKPLHKARYHPMVQAKSPRPR